MQYWWEYKLVEPVYQIICKYLKEKSRQRLHVVPWVILSYCGLDFGPDVPCRTMRASCLPVEIFGFPKAMYFLLFLLLTTWTPCFYRCKHLSLGESIRKFPLGRKSFRNGVPFTATMTQNLYLCPACHYLGICLFVCCCLEKCLWDPRRKKWQMQI